MAKKRAEIANGDQAGTHYRAFPGAIEDIIDPAGFETAVEPHMLCVGNRGTIVISRKLPLRAGDFLRDGIH